MKIAKLITLFLLALSLCTNQKITSFAAIDIGGGQNAEIEEFPHQIQIYRLQDGEFNFSCGGTIIYEDWILTAAHCLKDKNDNIQPNQIRIIAGTSKKSSANAQLTTNGVMREVVSIFVHTGYKYCQSSVNDDIGLIKLGQSLPTNNNPKIKRINIPVSGYNHLNNSKDYIVSGWGATSEMQFSDRKCDSRPDIYPQKTDLLKQLPVSTTQKIIARNKEYDGDCTQSHICVQSAAGNICSGDSGSPLTSTTINNKKIAIGIASYMQGENQFCTIGDTGIYTRISAYSNWIYDTIYTQANPFSSSCTNISYETINGVLGIRATCNKADSSFKVNTSILNPDQCATGTITNSDGYLICDTFPKVNLLPTGIPPAPSGYRVCGLENGVCTFAGVMDAAFGVNGKFNYKNSIYGGFSCNVNTFGDPAYGSAKYCYIKDPTPPGFTFCAKEEERCNFTGTKDVVFGANGNFNYKYNVSDGIGCNASVFVDRAYGIPKLCYVRNPRIFYTGFEENQTPPEPIGEKNLVKMSSGVVGYTTRSNNNRPELQPIIIIGQNSGIPTDCCTGNRAWEIKGKSTLDRSYAYMVGHQNLNIKVEDNLILIFRQNNMEQYTISLDGLFTDGTTFRDFAINNQRALKDQYGTPIHPEERQNRSGWTCYRVDLTPAKGKTIQSLMPAYDNGKTKTKAPYRALQDNISIGYNLSCDEYK